MEHVDKYGNSKILKECTLPLTAKGKVTLIITDLAVLKVTPEGLVLQELSVGTTVEDVVKATEAKLIIPDEIGTLAVNKTL